MAGYLSEQQLAEFFEQVSILPIKSFSNKDLRSFSFDCGLAEEYKTFLFEKAERLDTLAISKTFVMISNVTNELIGYFTLSADTVKLTQDEKTDCGLEEVSFMSLPAIKVGKLAINKKLSEKIRRKGYGSFALEAAAAKAFEALQAGIACRFITVDADIEYYPNTPEFYKKNGFVMNESRKRRPSDKTISMRRDIFA